MRGGKEGRDVQTKPSFLLLLEHLLLLEGRDAILETFVHGGGVDGGIVLFLCLGGAVHGGGMERGAGGGGGLRGGDEGRGRGGAGWGRLWGACCAIHGLGGRRGGGPGNAGDTKTSESVNVLET